MKFTVELTRSASADIADIVDWISRHDSNERALYVLAQIEQTIDSLAEQPDRGVIPMELRSLGIDRYREIFFKPYRVVYHVPSERVIVDMVADGRRDMSALLQRRLTTLR